MASFLLLCSFLILSFFSFPSISSISRKNRTCIRQTHETKKTIRRYDCPATATSQTTLKIPAGVDPTQFCSYWCLSTSFPSSPLITLDFPNPCEGYIAKLGICILQSCIPTSQNQLQFKPVTGVSSG